MSHRSIRAVVTALFVALLATTALFAQTSTSGSIEGTIKDATGSPLPGVTVEIKSAQLQGVKVETTDIKGGFRFSLIPPGTYSLTAKLSGFSPTRQANIVVGVSRTVTLDVQLTQAVSEQITVTAAAPVVDVSSNTTGANVTSSVMQALPMQRTYVAAIQVAPGTANDAVGATVYGSSGAENQYIIDGLNTTAARDGTQGKSLNNEFVQEVEVKTGGMPAEYGRLTGGVINAITKSGGNQLTGDVFGYNQAKNLRSDNKTIPNQSITASSVTETSVSQLDGGIDLGGYFIKDRLWFFGAYDYQKRTDYRTRVNSALNLPGYQLPVGAQIPTDVKNNLYAGKLTFRASDSQNLTASLFGDPTTQDGAIFAISGTPDTWAGIKKTGGNDFIGRYSGVFGSSFLVGAEVGRHNERIDYSGAGRNIPQMIDTTVTPNVTTGGFGFFGDEKYQRTIYKTDISKFISNHELKFGGDFEDLKGNLAQYQGGGGQRIYKMVTSTGQIYYRHRYYVDDKAPGFVRGDQNTWVIAAPLLTDPHTKNTSAYLQDAWKVIPNLTLNLGLRWEDQQVIGRGGVKAFEINTNWAPRVGVIWDVANNGRSKVYANYGRFYESIPMDINIRAYGGEQTCFCYNFSPNAGDIKGDPAARRSTLNGTPIEPSDPNLKGQYVDEFLAGYDYEVSPNFAVGIKGTYRKLASVIEDMLDPASGEYRIVNPGSGIGAEMSFYDTSLPAIAAPVAKRTYKGVELHATKHFSNRAQFFASYVWSRMEGNYDGTFQTSTGQLDPNINSAYDYADFLVNNHGLLSGDRTHTLKFYGSYTFDQGWSNGLTLGMQAHYYSGQPLTAYGYSPGYQNWEYYLTPRGALGRGPADYEADIHASYPIPAGSAKVELIADIFNVLNLQRKTSLDQRYNLISSPACSGFADPSSTGCQDDGGLNHIPGTLNPATTIDPNHAPNPTFLKAGTTFTGARAIRFGARLTF